MREAKYRGFSKDDGNWHFGHGHFLIKHCEDSGLEDYSVLHTDGSPKYVVPESVGEYTGLKDKNGLEIYEGDILAIEDDKFVWSVEYDLCCFVANGGEYNQKEELIEFYDWKEESLDVVIIGNIYEHPDLLEAN
ncbi:YopX family protein [Psychrobacillus sp. FSL K6-1267]|uniref:YopX family protein n=1 Tax=Psychrobacillus sp. FSL K6-1267 TaxID=2921543 RepID=UPI0030FA65B6